jgi:glycosyltransferase involved in cell wall biosynthesis/GT2 family glycosyltransferase
MTAPERRSTTAPFPAATASRDIDGLNAELARIREELATREVRISRLGRTVVELEERCAGLRHELAARLEELERLAEENRRYGADLRASRDEITRLSAEVEDLAADVRELHASTSWRVTSPLRGLKNAVLRLRSRLRETPSTESPSLPAAPVIENPEATLIAQSGLFDPDYYASQVPGLRERGVDLVTHYLTRGAAEGLDPNPVFDSSFYLERYPDVASSGENPLIHYLRAGAAERRDPHPLFETSFYLEQTPHVVALGVNPLAHFLAEGPTPAFDPLSVPPPVPDTGICIVTPDLVGPVKNGGIGTACYHFARILAQDGHPVTVLFTCDLSPCRGAHWRNTYARMGIGFVPLEDTPPLTHDVIGSNWFMDRSWRVYEYLKRTHHSVIHFQDWHANGFWSIKAKRVGLAFDRTTLTVMTHSPTKWQDDGMQQFGPEPIETAKLVWAEGYAIEHCDVLLSPTRYMLDWLSQNGFPQPESMIVTPNSYIENTEPAARRGEVDNDHLIFFGRLETRKGLYVFGEALRRLRRDGGPLPHTVSFLGTLVTVNGRPAAEYLERLRQDMAPIEIRVIDTLDHAGAREHIERTRGLVVLPSLVDNCPFVVIESIENRFPFIAARTGGIPDMVDPKATFEPTIEGLTAVLAERHGIDHAGMRHPYSVRDATRIWRDLHGEDGPFGGRRPSPASPTNCDALPRVSVCIPFFEQSRYLETLIAALADQSYPDLEVVVVNDGSGPEASEAFDHVATVTRDGRFRFLTAQNRGPGAACNAAAEAATGDLLLFFHADALPKRRDFVATLVRALRRSGADCLTCTYDVVSADHLVPTEQDVISTYRPWGPCLVAGFVENILGDSTMIIWRAAFMGVDRFSERRPSWETHEFLLRFCFKGFRLETSPEALLYHREDPSLRDRQLSDFFYFQSLFEQLHAAPSRDLARIIATVGGPTLVGRLGARSRTPG